MNKLTVKQVEHFKQLTEAQAFIDKILDQGKAASMVQTPLGYFVSVIEVESP